jgi:hypothetical protein
MPKYTPLMAEMIYAGLVTMPERRAGIHMSVYAYVYSGGRYGASN